MWPCCQKGTHCIVLPFDQKFIKQIFVLCCFATLQSESAPIASWEITWYLEFSRLDIILSHLMLETLKWKTVHFSSWVSIGEAEQYKCSKEQMLIKIFISCYNILVCAAYIDYLWWLLFDYASICSPTWQRQKTKIISGHISTLAPLWPGLNQWTSSNKDD